MARNDAFTTLHTEGAILPNNLLERIASGDKDLGGLQSEDYHLGGIRLTDSISRSWLELSLRWRAFQEQLTKLPAGDPATSVTRERWLLPLFQELGYGRLGRPAEKFVAADKEYPISHLWGKTPIHLLGCRVDIDKRQAGVAGAARISPHSLMQEFLNQSDQHIWGFVSNGFKLRILRDNKSLTRQAYVEFDLQAMFDGEVYSDFVLFWLLCHQSRVEAEKPEECWLEKWYSDSQKRGIRALDSLRIGVENAIIALGSGFISNRSNASLLEKLRSGELDRMDYYRQLLRLVYRFIFLLVAENRNLLLDPEADDTSRRRYNEFYSVSRLRSLSERLRGTRHTDLWEGLKIVFRFLGSADGYPPLALKGLGSFLWSDSAVADLIGCKLQNRSLLRAIFSLSFTVVEKTRHIVDYRNLGPEELGSVYEALLEMHPELDLNAGLFSLKAVSGNERKTTGSYYTPSELVQCLIDSALEPVLNDAASQPDPENALLNLKICDPACGSGHFLIAASHRVAKQLARARTGEDEPSPEAIRHALRDVIGRCLYGVDINPMSVELCKISLWMEAMEPGKPLSFLDHHIRCGNSLIGATPALLESGIPDEAFITIEGDSKAYCSQYKKINKKEREGARSLFDLTGKAAQQTQVLLHKMEEVSQVNDQNIDDIHKKEKLYDDLLQSNEHCNSRLIADAWCSAFVWIKKDDEHVPEPITQDKFRQISNNPPGVPELLSREIIRLANQYKFFHWHLEFPDVFAKGGFDCVLGNPPWERVKLQEKEWFAERSPMIANAPNAAARKRLIEALKISDPSLFHQFHEDSRQAEGESHLLRHSGRYPLCGRGDINLYSVFAEEMRNLLTPLGTMGAILPSGLATDDTTKYFFSDLIDRQSLSSFYEFENEGFFIGVGQGHMVRFALTTIRGRSKLSTVTDFVFQAKKISDLGNNDQHFALSSEDIALINPNTRTCPIFRTRRDAELTKAIYRRVPVLIREMQNGCPEENLWDISFKRMFDMANDSHFFRTREQLESDCWRMEGNVFYKESMKYLPLYEAKMIQQYNHRYGDFSSAIGQHAHILPHTSTEHLQQPDFFTMPCYWVPESEVLDRMAHNATRGWLIGWRDVTDARASVRTIVACVIPRAGVSGKFPLIISMDPALPILYASLLSFVSDYVARQKVAGLALGFFTMQQLSILQPDKYSGKCLWADKPQTLKYWLQTRVLELTYTAWDLESFAQDCGWSGPPFRWDEERRFLIRCELDAAFFHLYLASTSDGQWKSARIADGAVHDETPEELPELKRHFPTPRHAVDYIMDTFPIVRRKDEDKYGEYRTKRIILEIYNAMQEAIRTGKPYQTRLDPPPGDPKCCHPSKQ